MPGLVALVNLISMDASYALVTAGYVARTLTITGATNTSPVVVTTSEAHRIFGSGTLVVSGVLGNTAANGTWLAVPSGTAGTELALYDLLPDGTQVAVTGNAAYTGGGTVKSAFTDGKLVIGRVREEENSDVPRCILIPKASRFSARDQAAHGGMTTQNPYAQGAEVRSYTLSAYGSGYVAPTVTVSAPDLSTGTQATATAVLVGDSIMRILPAVAGTGYLRVPTVTITDATGTGAVATANLGLMPEQRTMAQQRAVQTDTTVFEVQVWGAAATPGYDADFDAVRAIYQQVIASAHRLCWGIVTFSVGKWAGAAPNTTQILERGHVFVFDMAIDTPVLDAAVEFANAPVRAAVTAQQQAPDTGTVGTGWQGTV